MTLPATAPTCPPSGDRFPLGRLVMTQGAERAIDDAGDDPFVFLSRHASGDWGEVSEEEGWVNERAVARGLRLLSAYRTSRGIPLWVVTGADRRTTTIMLAPGDLPMAGPRRHPSPAGRGDNKALGAVICPECGGSDFRHVECIEQNRVVKGFNQVGTLVIEGLVTIVDEAPKNEHLVCVSCHAELDLPDDLFFL